MAKPRNIERRRGTRASDFTLDAEPLPYWRDAKQAVEQWLLERALARTGGNMAAAARQLGITKVAVLHAVRRHNLEHLTGRSSAKAGRASR